MGNKIFFPSLPKKYSLFLKFLIFSFIRELITMLLVNDFWDEEERIEKRYFEILYNVGCDLLTGIFVLFFTIRNIKESVESSVHRTTDNKINLYIYNDTKRNCWSLFKNMFMLASIDFVCQFLFFFFVVYFKNDDIISRPFQGVFLVVDVICRYFFSAVILNTYFYRHHWVSFQLNLIGLIFMGFVDVHKIYKMYNNYDPTAYWFYIIFLIVQYILYSLEDVLNKKVLVDEYLTPCLLLFYKGLYQIPYFIFVSLYFWKQFIDRKVLQNFYDTKKEKLWIIIVARSVYIISNIGRSIHLVEVIDTFTSQYFSIVKVLESLLLFFVFMCKGEYDEWWSGIIVGISFFILVFSSLLHNEIIIVNYCGLEEHTQYGLDKQAEKDINDAFTDKSKLSESDSDSSLSNDASFNTQNLSGSD